jgi:hypothetical protein
LHFALAIFAFLCYIFSKRSLASAGGIILRGAAQGVSRFCGRRTEGGCGTMKTCTKVRIAAAGVLALAIILLSIKSDRRTENRRA